jgi:hypothetical protein
MLGGSDTPAQKILGFLEEGKKPTPSKFIRNGEEPPAMAVNDSESFASVSSVASPKKRSVR